MERAIKVQDMKGLLGIQKGGVLSVTCVSVAAGGGQVVSNLCCFLLSMKSLFQLLELLWAHFRTKLG